MENETTETLVETGMKCEKGVRSVVLVATSLKLVV